MKPLSKKVIQIHAPGITAGGTDVGSGVTNYMDTKGFDYALVDVHMSTTNDTTNNPTVLQLYEADVTTSSSFATVSGSIGDTDFTVATMSASVSSVYRFGVDLKKRKRFLKVSCYPLTTQDITITADLFIAEELPNSASEAGVNNLVLI